MKNTREENPNYPYVEVDLSYPLYLRLTDPKQYHLYPVQFLGRDGTQRLWLKEEDAIKVLLALARQYPLEALGAIK
jgi:hypothetical protein